MSPEEAIETILERARRRIRDLQQENYKQSLAIASLQGQLMDVAKQEQPLTTLSRAAHSNAVDHDFWDDPAPEFGTSIALVHTEVTEAFEEWRHGEDFTTVYWKHANGSIVSHPEDFPPDEVKPEGIPIELADILIRVFDIAGRYGIDLDTAVAQKMAYNTTRPSRHGGKRA